MAKINYIGHATVLMDIGQLRVLTDPILRDRVFFLQRHGANPAPALLEERLPDVVLISHLHYDHADLPSLRALPADVPVLVPHGAGSYLARRTGVSAHEMRAGDTVRIRDVDITALPANHGSAWSLPLPASPCLGYVVQNRLSVYFAGDTDLFDEMEDVGQDYDLDLALLPVWGYSYRVGEGHLTPSTAATALRRLRPRVAVPIHWGALRLPGPHALWHMADHMHSPPHAFAAHAARVAPKTQVHVLKPGEWLTLN
ncbi:MAG TPA: MBL fold metallo-hydrolase [Anaerolineae bacterium]|nr:MBL fold metallo-hydrolase [Anaerolineae bacterium]